MLIYMHQFFQSLTTTASGIPRCGGVLGGRSAIAVDNAKAVPSTAKNRFPLSDAMVSSLVRAFLTDGTSSLRAKAFLRSFVRLQIVTIFKNPARALKDLNETTFLLVNPKATIIEVFS